ncbi:MAG: hypothetical protein JWN51_1423, partial [Phycisphaerales bacterium]|nr:hypothetical protein [Phycisphaerales bacterium]
MSLDGAFGNNGLIVTPLTATSNSGVAIQSDGKILLAGADASGTSYLTRLNPDGSVDPSFGNHGVAQVATGLESAGILPEFVLIQPDGKIVVGITGGISGPSIIPVGGTLHRFNADGSPDTNFGKDGQVAAMSGQIEAVALGPDGAIIVGGENLVTSNSTQIVVARVKADGSIDSGFGQNGLAAIPSGTKIEDVLVTPDDKILVGGFNYSGTPNTLLTNFVYRFNVDGTADTNFDASGIATTTSGTDMYIEDMTVLPDGSLLILKFNTGVVALTRCNYDGSLDTSFGNGGTIGDVGGGTFMIGAYRLAVRATGEIVVEGDGTNAVYCGHFTPDGKLLQSETTSTHNGWDPFSQQPLPNPTPTPLPDRYLFGGAIDADGKLVVAGGGYVARLNSDGYVWSGDPNFHWA